MLLFFQVRLPLRLRPPVSPGLYPGGTARYGGASVLEPAPIRNSALFDPTSANGRWPLVRTEPRPESRSLGNIEERTRPVVSEKKPCL